MRNTILIGAYGLSDDQIAFLKKSVPAENYEIMDTDCFTDIIAHSEMANVIVWDRLSDEDKSILIDFYTEIAPFSETMIIIGDADLPKELKNCVLVYPTFDDFSTNAKYMFLNARRKAKKNKEFSETLANCLKILSLLRDNQYITTQEIAEKLDKSTRTIQRYIETLRVAGESIDYDIEHKGWTLTEAGKSILWGDI